MESLASAGSLRLSTGSESYHSCVSQAVSSRKGMSYQAAARFAYLFNNVSIEDELS